MSACTKTGSAAAFLLIGSIGTVATAQIDYDWIRNEVGAVRIEARVQRFEPIQSVVAGAFPIHTSNYDVVAVWDPPGGRAHESWDMELIYPLPGEMQISFTSNEYGGNQAAERRSCRPIRRTHGKLADRRELQGSLAVEPHPPAGSCGARSRQQRRPQR